jgi:hypothetical protein
MSKSNKNVSKLLFSVIITAILLLAGSCQNWMSSDDFMSKIENEVHDANAPEVKVYVRYANSPAMGTTEPSGNTTMKVDVVSKVTAVTSDDYGFVKWAAFSTSDFATNKNYSNLTFISQEDYDNNIKDKELTSEDIVFSNPTDPVTEVKILKQRDDIFIIPIVAARPTYVQSVPAGGDYGVVKNTSIRILFSKAIDKSTLYDSEGKLNYSITSSAAVLVDDSQDIEAKDITDYFDANLSESGKMLTLKLKVDAKGEIVRLLDNRARITITLFEGLCDRDGFSMSKNYSFNFQTGTNTDSLAPMIEVIFGGTGEKCDVFVSYHNVDEDGVATINGVATDAAKKAPQDINSTEYTDALVAQRIYDKLNLYIKATDVIASGNADINPAKDLNEDNVAYVAIAASLYVDKDGKPVEINETNSIAKENFVYISGEMDSTSQMTSLFNDVVPKDKDGVKYTGGSIYTYDVSNLPDGLIKLDIWGIDMTGNSGGPNDAGSPYYTKHDNGYKSIFVVKDTTAPDSATESKKLKSNSAAAPYYWYNSETLSTMELFDLDDNQIVDRGHAKLRSLAKNLQWNFVVGKSTEAPAASDAGWKNIHNAETGASIKYTLADAKAPANDGPIDITLYIRDDIGNTSAPVLLDSLMYDNTKPTVTLLDNYGDFVNEDGGKELHSSKEAVINQILKVSFTEPNVNNAGSGIRRVEIHVKKEDSEVAFPLDSTKFKVKWSAAADATPKTASEIAMAADDTATTDKLKVFNVNDSAKITTGTLFIYGLTLGDDDGDYTVTVDLYDSAMNKTTATAKTKISRDKTSPVINSVNVQGALVRTVYGDTAGTKTWWMPKDKYESGNLTKVILKVSAVEAGSGLEAIKVGNDVEFTSATILKKGDTELVKGTDYKFDESDPTHKIVLLNNYDVLLKGTPIEFTLENVKFNTINNAAGNKVNVEVQDFVGTTPDSNQIGDTENYQITYPDNTTGTLVYADNTPPQISTLHVEDTIQKNATNPDHVAYNKDDFTDDQIVILTLKLYPENSSNGSGVKIVHLSDNAEFTSSTAIYVDTNTTPLSNNVDYTIAGDNKSVEFTKVFTGEETLKFTNVKIISEVDGNQIIKADLTDFVGLKTTASTATNTIILDKVSPVVSNRAWVTTDSTVTTGTAGEMTIDNQSLKIDFTENTAGVKVIKFNIYHSSNPSVVFDNPFDSVDFYYNDTLLTKDTDYTIDTSNKQYIILTTPRKTGSFMFKNVKLTNTNTQGNYVIDVVLLDAAENRPVDDCKITIAIDKDAPVIKEKLNIPNLLHAVELTTNGGQKVIADDTDGNGTWWLKKDYVGAGTNQVPAAIPVYIKVEEKGSGIKFITLGGDATISDSTKLHKIASNGSTTDLVVNADYTVVNKTITIINSLNAFSDDSDFQIYLENVGFANLDSGTVSQNTITAKVTDVALHESDPMAQDEQHIYSDSQLPASPTNFKLLDRAFDKNAATPTIEASEDYTNDSIVDMEFELDDSEQFGSGYHKFEIAGATFRDDSVITMTTLDGTPIVCDGQAALTRELSNSNTVLTLKSSGSISYNYVIRQAVKVKITNVQLDNTVDGQQSTVTLTAYDLVGRANTPASDSIWYDISKPELEKLFTANYVPSNATYYQPSINVYPHANSELATGVSIDYGTQERQKGIPTFYTATTYETGKSISAGKVVTDSYGAVLGVRGKDNVMLCGWSRAKTFIYYYKYSDTDTPFSKSKTAIIENNNNPLVDINNACKPNGDNTAQSTSLWLGFSEGKYSAVIVDEAGNVSEPFDFAVVKDITKPAKEWGSGNDADSLNARVLLQKPDASANIFTNSAVSTISTSDGFPRFWGCGSDQDTMSANSSMKTKKYVTKKSSNKYKIQLNLGGTVSNSTLSSKINGGAASDVTPYSDLTPTDTSSPIEMYAVSTLYGSWPDADHPSYKYCPVVPSGTSFPSGQTYSNSSSICKDYFGYTNGFSDYWYIYNSSSANWHPYKTSTSSNTDSYSYSSLSVSITSYVDSNNNLIIEIPNTKSTVPISVFLKDGCGNMEYVVCGLYKENGYDVAISFVIDDKLGSAPTSDGIVTTPFIIQFPYSYYDSTSDVQWGDYNFHVGTQAGNSEAPSSQYGTGQKRGFIKDSVKHATYYNPALTDTVEARQIKHCFALHFFPNGVDRNEALNITGKESITFSDADWTDTEKAKGVRKASATDIADGNYTCRALLYCTNTTDVPTYAQIKACHDEEMAATAANKTGQVTDWSYVQVSSSAIEAILFVDYPKPNYTKLNWNVNENNGEPKPFYMWYIFEDAVGNYELAKVVNDATSGNYLKTINSSHFDKWLYDPEAPKLTIRGSITTENPNGTSPDTITAANISQLVATNNGYVPYVNGNNIYVHANITDNTSLRDGCTLNTATGTGIFHEGAASYGITKFAPFADLEVSERTGIRAFTWSTSSDSTFDYDNSYGYNTTWLSSTSAYWYIGWQGVSSSGGLAKNIGDSHAYDGEPQHAYFGTNTSYSGKYSGVKINTVIPYGKLSTNSATELWLHVMDWTGNISHYRMGASGIKFINDSTAPTYSSNAFDGITEPDQYYISKASSSNPVVRIAGNGPTAKAGSDIKLYIPKTWIVEAGSGIKGYSFSNTGLANATYDENGDPYLNLTYSDYHYTDTDSHEKTFYVYDNVGNMSERKINLVFDDKPPKITTVAFVTKLDSSDQGKFCDAETGLGTQDGFTSFGSVRFYTHKDKNSANEDINLYYEDLSHFKDGEVQEIYISKAGAVKFQVNFASEILTETDYLDDIKINRWNTTTSKWETVTSWKSNNSDWWVGATDTGIRAMGTSDSTGYNTLTYTATGTYYQILATDISGNANCQYFKLYLDNQGPELTKDEHGATIKPQVTVGKGSINTVSGVTYYTAGSTDDEALRINFAVQDGGLPGQTLQYSLDGNAWTDVPANGQVELLFKSDATGTIQNIYLKDIFENPTTYTGGYAYADRTLSSLTKYTGSAPAALTITTEKSGGVNDTIKEIKTAKVYDNGNAYDWQQKYTQLLANNQVLISNKDRKKLRITFEKPSSTDMIMGYIRCYGTDEPSQAKETYNFITKPTSDVTFDEGLPFETYPTTVKYYKVDVVGNISPALTLTYTNENPHKAKNITLIKTIDDVKTKEGVVDSDVVTAMTDAGIIFAKYRDIPDTEEKYKNYGKTGLRYFNGNYIVLRCTLQAKAAPEITDENDENYYAETPSLVELWDVYSTGKTQRGGADKTSATNFKVFPSSLKDGERFYCYIAIKDPNFDNNDSSTDYGGSVIHAKIKGADAESTLQALNTSDVEKYGWKMDNEAPFIHEHYAATVDGHKVLYNYAIKDSEGTDYTGSQQIAYDNNGGSNPTNLYSAGSKLYCYINVKLNPSSNDKTTCIKDNVTDWQQMKYKLVITEGYNATASADDTDWIDMTPDNGNYVYELPEVKSPHKRIALFLMDELDNITAPHYLGKEVNDTSVQYWLIDRSPAAADISIKKNTGTESAPVWSAPEYSASAQEFTVSFGDNGPGVVIHSVTAENATISNVTFNDYNTQPESIANQAWVNVSSIKVTLTPFEKIWTPQPVTLKINGVSKDVFEIPVRSFTSDDITLTDQTWTSGDTVYVPISFPTGAGVGKITSYTANNDVTVTLDTSEADNPRFKLTSLPSQGWSDTVINITINGSIEKKALTIPAKALGSGDITVATADYDGTKTSYDLAITLNNNAPASALTKITADNEVSAQLSNDKTKVTLSSIPEKGWTEKKIKLTANDTIDLGIVLTVPVKALAATDINSIDNAVTENNTTTVTINLKEGVPDSALETAGVTVTPSSVHADLTGHVVTLTDIPDAGWDEQKITLTVGSNLMSKDVLTIAPKNLAATDIVSIGDAVTTNGVTTVEITLNTDVPASALSRAGVSADHNVSTSLSGTTVTLSNVPAATWTAQDITLTIGSSLASHVVYTVPVKTYDSNCITIDLKSNTWPADGNWSQATIEVTSELPIDKIETTNANMFTVTVNSKWDDDKTASVNLAKATGDSAVAPTEDGIVIKVTTKSNASANKGVYKEVSSNPNRFFGRLISGKGDQDVYTFGDSPKTAGALQSHVVEVPKFIQKFWQNDETAADEVSSTVTKEAKKAEKKSSKKSTKKAAKKAVETVTETAATIAVTEHPTELLEEPVAEDQLAMILPKTANTEEAELVEPQASVSAGAVDVSVTEAEPAEHSNAALWIILAVFCAAIAGVVLCLKKKRA